MAAAGSGLAAGLLAPAFNGSSVIQVAEISPVAQYETDKVWEGADQKCKKIALAVKF